MGRWERSIDVANHPSIHGAGSSSNNGLVVVLSLVLFGALVLLAVQINPFRPRSASTRKQSGRQPASD